LLLHSQQSPFVFTFKHFFHKSGQHYFVFTMVSIHNKKSWVASNNHFLVLSLAPNALLVLNTFNVSILTMPLTARQSLRGEAVHWHGGHPADSQSGSCHCSSDRYCMCTPALAIDLVITSGTDHVWLVRRKDTNQLAIMGGFVIVGETVEHAVKREIQEEMGIDLVKPPQLLGIYSDPRRDNRWHTVSSVFAVHLGGEEKPVAADDVKEVKRIPLADIEKYEYFADHKTVLLDYRRSLCGDAISLGTSEGDFASDIQRSVCGNGILGPSI
jgi:8-oxo-dGTP diphosphatase